MSAEISKLSLTPVYGSIPPIASLNWLRGGFERDQRYVAIVILVSSARMFFSKHTLGFSKHFAILGFFTPSIQMGLYSLSGKFGPLWGPRITYVSTSVFLLPLSLLHLVILITEAFSLTLSAKGTASYSTKAFCGTAFGTGLLTSTLYYSLVRVSSFLEAMLPTLIMWNYGTHVIFSRVGFQSMTALMFAVLGASLERSKLVFTAVLPLIHLVFLSPHFPLSYNTHLLNSTIQVEGFSLVARQESLTGYISVLDNVNEGYRVMRCDHSLLGGEYLRKPRGSRYKEPVYTIFLTLEAVRLLQLDLPESQLFTTSEDEQALVMYVLEVLDIELPLTCSRLLEV